jgi:hypothetical protein
VRKHGDKVTTDRQGYSPKSLLPSINRTAYEAVKGTGKSFVECTDLDLYSV